MGTAKRTKRRWDGGYIVRDSRGRDAYYIRKQLDGRRYDVSTGCHGARAAMEQLEQFEADPAAYRPGGPPGRAPLYLDTELAAEFLTWSRDVKHNSRAWLAKQRAFITWWAEQLTGLDLRKVSLVEDILPALEGAASRTLTHYICQ